MKRERQLFLSPLLLRRRRRQNIRHASPLPPTSSSDRHQTQVGVPL